METLNYKNNWMAYRTRRITDLIAGIQEDRVSMSRVCSMLSANGISYKITVKEPDIIQYWDNYTGVEGSIPKIL